MDIWLKIIDAISNLEVKDRVTLAVSTCALVVAIFSFRQKSGEGRLALRKQLTDLFEKLTDLNTEVAKFRAKKEDYPANYPGLLNDQRRFLVRQAAFVAKKIPGLVSPYEYLLLAGGFDEISDWGQAEHFFEKAISTASSSIDRGIAVRGYGRYLYSHGRLEDARKRYATALGCFKGESDRVRGYRADTYERWAAHEREWSGDAEADRLLQDAVGEYQRFTNPLRRQEEIKRVRALISTSPKAAGKAIGTEPIGNAQIVREFVDQVLNQGSIDAVGRFFWEDMIEEVPLPGQGPGLQGLKDVLRGLRAAFPDIHWSVEEQIAAGDKVVTRFEWTGTHHGTFLNVPPTGRRVKVWGMVIDRVQDGRIKNTRIIMDTLGMMTQLGVVPPPSA